MLKFAFLLTFRLFFTIIIYKKRKNDINFVKNNKKLT